jgi:tRNA modification GTPase
MQLPSTQDTIVAVSSSWTASPVGIIRLSGPDSGVLVVRLGVEPPPPEIRLPAWTAVTVRVTGDAEIPASAHWFCAPRSYTGQDVVELHTVGCLPMLRHLCERLIDIGARRALPGEFTARALLCGRLDASQVEGILALMSAHQEAGLRQAARRARTSQRATLDAVRERLVDLLARVEAGIDFVDEEDVRFVTPEEVRHLLNNTLDRLAPLVRERRDDARAGKPHVALVGLPNAGKSTLFNALLGFERALVSPVLGTTRDVLSAEIDIEGTTVVLQDCAGLGDSAGDLELATHLASETVAEQADVVLWIHAADEPWQRRESELCQRLAERCVLVVSKIDRPEARGSVPDTSVFRRVVRVSVPAGTGLGAVRRAVMEQVQVRAAEADAVALDVNVEAGVAALRRARELAPAGAALAAPELIALELREALAVLAAGDDAPVDEAVLGRVFSQFCVGK